MKVTIKSLGEDDRPREKMLKHGAGALSKAELLALLVGSGNNEENAVTLMQRIMHDCGDSLHVLGTKSVGQLTAYKGIGEAKAVVVKAACQLGRLMQTEQVNTDLPLSDSNAVRNYFATLADMSCEEVWVLLLNNRLQPIGKKLISKGGITEATVDIRLVLREAIMAQATAIILVHNHPTGNVSPSKADDNLTGRLADATKMINISLIDHVIVGGNRSFSYRDAGRL